MDCRLVLAIALLPALVTVAAAHEADFAPSEGVLVLRNGHVVHGQITRLGDRYVVTFGEASEVRFPVGDVEFQCASIEEAYLRKRDLLDPTSVRQRLDLADWCLRHSLPHRAADQMLAALTINPFDARARGLRRRLMQLCEARQIAQDFHDPGPQVDWDAVEQVMETTPPVAVEEFTRTIQLLLINRCGTNACHGSEANSRFHLMRPMKDKALPRRLSQRNLYSTLQMIDYRNPEQSPLLLVPRGPHGGEEQGLFSGKQDVQWLQLRDWVLAAARPTKPSEANAAPAEVSTGTDDGPNARQGIATMTRPMTAEAANGEIHRSVFSPAPAGPPKTQPPRDPFDPEIFNRRYFPEKSIPLTEKTPDEAASKN